MTSLIVFFCTAIGLFLFRLYLSSTYYSKNRNLFVDKNKHPFDKEEIKLFVESAQEQGYTIHVEWIQNHSESDTSIFLSKDNEKVTLSNKNAKHLGGLKYFFLFCLYDHLKMYYIEGKGVLKYENQQVVAYYQKTQKINNSTTKEIVEFDLEDKLSIISTSKHRAEFVISYSFCIKENILTQTTNNRDDQSSSNEHFRIDTYIREGDEIMISKEEETYYQAQFAQVAKRLLEEEALHNSQLISLHLSYYIESDTNEKAILHFTKKTTINNHFPNEKAVII